MLVIVYKTLLKRYNDFFTALLMNFFTSLVDPIASIAVYHVAVVTISTLIRQLIFSGFDSGDSDDSEVQVAIVNLNTFELSDHNETDQ